MIRRFAIAALFVLVVSACAAGTQGAVDAGDTSLSREEVSTFVSAFQGAGDGTPPASLEGTNTRLLATAYLRSQAFSDYFEAEGIPVPDALRESVEQEVIEASTSGQLGRLEFDSPEFEAFVDVFVLQTFLGDNPVGTLDPNADSEETFPEQSAILEEFTEGFSVESRLGVWDDEVFAIVAN